MFISQDALLTTLLFLLPGFIAVGAYVVPFKWLNPPDLSRSAFAILALSLSVPINWAFATLARFSPRALARAADVPRLGSPTLSRHQLLGIALLYLFAAALGLAASVGATWARGRRWKTAGTCVRPSRDSVWHHVLKSRTGIPWVVAVLETHAYYGKLRHYTTSTDDPNVFITHVQLVPLDAASGLPQLSEAVEPPMDGVLIRLESLKALWFVT